MKDITGSYIPGMETHAYLAHYVATISSPEFLHDIARLLETEQENTRGEWDDADADDTQGNHSRPEDGTAR